MAKRKRSSRTSAKPAMPNASTRPAAISIASGIPSRWEQILATAGACASVSENSPMHIAARSTKSCTAEYVMAIGAVRMSETSGIAKGARRNRISPETRIDSRLVARIRSFVLPRRSDSASRAAVSITCSQLSSTISISRLRSSATRFGSGSSETTPIPSADARAVGTNLLSARGAKSTTHTPSGSPARIRSATANATEVLPIPPGPVMVISRYCASLFDNVSTTSARPNNRAMDSGGSGSGGASAAGSGSSFATTLPTKE